MNRDTLDLLKTDVAVRRAWSHALGRAYPLLKQAAEILELEQIEPMATRAKTLRQDVGAMLAIEGADGSAEFE